MMASLWQILSPDFLLRNSVYIGVLIGVVCPLVGVFLVLRRLVFMGVALPQISSTGIALAVSLPFWIGYHPAAAVGAGEHTLAFAGATVFSLVAIFVLAMLERRGRGSSEGRLGMAYVVAAAVSILLLANNRVGEAGWLDLLKGEIITVSNFDLALTASVLALVLLVLGLFHKEIMLVSFDPGLAQILGKRVAFWDTLLYLLIGLAVSMAVLSVGPLVAFGFLLIPALTAQLFDRTMKQFVILAALLGGVTAFLGFWLAYQWDWPVGPTDVTLLGVLYGSAWLGRFAVRLLTKSRTLRPSA